ncbi:MAG: hypothetical protein AAF389_09545 [Gemmatimonadota bacterium]
MPRDVVAPERPERDGADRACGGRDDPREAAGCRPELDEPERARDEPLEGCERVCGRLGADRVCGRLGAARPVDPLRLGAVRARVFPRDGAERVSGRDGAERVVEPLDGTARVLDPLDGAERVLEPPDGVERV